MLCHPRALVGMPASSEARPSRPPHASHAHQVGKRLLLVPKSPPSVASSCHEGACCCGGHGEARGASTRHRSEEFETLNLRRRQSECGGGWSVLGAAADRVTNPASCSACSVARLFLLAPRSRLQGAARAGTCLHCRLAGPGRDRAARWSTAAAVPSLPPPPLPRRPCTAASTTSAGAGALRSVLQTLPGERRCRNRMRAGVRP